MNAKVCLKHNVVFSQHNKFSSKHSHYTPYNHGDIMIWMTLNHWGRVMHICVSKLTIIGSDNGLSPGRRQAIIWTNDGILLIRTFWTHFSEIVSEIHTFSFKKMHFKMSSGKWQPSCLGLNDLKLFPHQWHCVQEIYWLPVDSKHKGLKLRALMVSLLLAWICFWTTSSVAGYMRSLMSHVASPKW